MPELPEVQALCDSLAARLSGAVIDEVRMRSIAALKTYDPPLSALNRAAVSGCDRRGKFVVLHAGDLHLITHLGRSGWLRVRDQPTAARPSLRGPLVMVAVLRDGRALEATEPGTERHLAVYLVRRPEDVPGIERLGLDACDPQLTPERLRAALAGRPGTLKAALADQAVLAGIGNAYSDEILHAARTSPFRPAASLDAAAATTLHQALHEVLSAAIARARAVDPDSLRTDKKLRMSVHGRTGQPCPVCGDTIREVAFASRSFQYCPRCQTGGRVHADRRLSRLLR